MTQNLAMEGMSAEGNLHQLVITRAQDGGIRVQEMGDGITQREHLIQPEISADMAARYIAKRLADLVAVGRAA